MADISTKPPLADPDTPVIARQGLLPELERRLRRSSADTAAPVTVGELRRLFSLPRWLDEVLAHQLAVKGVRDALIGEGGLIAEFEARLGDLSDDAPSPLTAAELRPLLNLLHVLFGRLAKVH
jgi:hypothetical protein